LKWWKIFISFRRSYLNKRRKSNKTRLETFW